MIGGNGTLPALRLLLLLALLPVLPACASRLGPEALATVRPEPGQKQVGVYVVTTRTRLAGHSNAFDTGKSLDSNFAAYTISVPPGHKPAQVEWKSGKPNPEKSFTVAAQQSLSREQFRKDMARQKLVGVFVHGYNFNFQESLFRMAQMTADADLPGTPILFSWPSQGALAGYVADKEAATYSRDYLADLLIDLTRGRGRGEVVVMAHSMGGWLTVETLRQLRLQGCDDVLSRLTVILAAPDIDADVFRTQIAVIGRMDPPMTILTSSDDRALLAARYINASTQRIGALNVADPAVREAAVRAGIQLIDISGVDNPDDSNHNRYASMGQLYPALVASNRKASLGQAGAFVFDAAGRTISSPFRIVSNVLSR